MVRKTVLSLPSAESPISEGNENGIIGAGKHKNRTSGVRFSACGIQLFSGISRFIHQDRL